MDSGIPVQGNLIIRDIDDWVCGGHAARLPGAHHLDAGESLEVVHNGTSGIVKCSCAIQELKFRLIGRECRSCKPRLSR